MLNAPEVNQLIAQAIRVSTQEVFSTMLGLSIAPGPITVEQQPPSAQSGMVALVGVAGAWSGTGCVACSSHFACKMAGYFLSSEYDAVDDEVLDALGEIANMIVGNVKGELEADLGTMGLSTPTIIFGRNLQTRSARMRDWIVVPFDCGDERMFVQMCLTPEPARKPVRGGFTHALQMDGV